MANNHRVSIQFHNTLASLQPAELDLLKSTQACMHPADLEGNGNGTPGSRHLTILVAHVEKDVTFVLPIYKDVYDPSALFSSLRSNVSKLVLKPLGQETKLSLLGFAFATNKVDWTDQYQTMPMEAKNLTWHVVADSLMSIAASNNIDLIACGNLPAEIILGLSKSMPHFCMASSSLFLPGYTSDSPFKQCDSGRTVFYFRNTIINRLLQKEYPLSSQSTTLLYKSA